MAPLAITFPGIPLFPERNCNRLRWLAIVVLRDKIALFPEENGVFGVLLGLPDKDEVRSSTLGAPTSKALCDNELRKAFCYAPQVGVCCGAMPVPCGDESQARGPTARLWVTPPLQWAWKQKTMALT
jgi:hypothetical protein